MGQVWSFTIKHKHLTLSDRNDIQIGIEQKKTFREIVSAIEKDPSTISKEVRKHLFIRESTVKSNCDACPLLKKAPYVCNTYPKKRLDCGFKKQFYYAKRAHQDYEQLLSERRKGIALNKQSFYD
ncbi:transcriptional regulator, partial [Streptococcus agalactiae LMG 14747]